MTIRLVFPSVTVEKSYLHKEQDFIKEFTSEYFELCKQEIDAMRKSDTEGRHRSNQGIGWQSKDGIDTNPVFSKIRTEIKRVVSEELMNYLGAEPGTAECIMHNSWANINHKDGWNAPHIHNGCFYSGVLYIHADGDEGNIRYIDTHNKITGGYPHMPRLKNVVKLQPKTGDLFLFPSGLMHMVEPNTTQKDRYSISFNVGINWSNIKIKSTEILLKENAGFVYEVNKVGKVISR